VPEVRGNLRNEGERGATPASTALKRLAFMEKPRTAGDLRGKKGQRSKASCTIGRKAGYEQPSIIKDIGGIDAESTNQSVI